MRKNEVRTKISRAALQLAEGVFSYSVDMTLWLAVYYAELSLVSPASGKLWRAHLAADRFTSQVNYDVIKNALISARRNGWVKKGKRTTQPEITKAGKRRLWETLPRYDSKRVWDKRIHLVTYDIPESKKIQRETLRGYLKRIGCGKLQDSVWITPYNPIDTLRKFITEKELGGMIIISNMGKDASIGEEDIQTLLVRIYGLESLNDRYTDWLEEASKFGRIDQYLLMRYFAILRDDPQIPFALLPSWWKGDTAYKKIHAVINMLSTKLL